MAKTLSAAYEKYNEYQSKKDDWRIVRWLRFDAWQLVVAKTHSLTDFLPR